MKIAFIASVALMLGACTTGAETKTTTTTQQVEATASVEGSVMADVAYIDVEYALSQSDIYTSEGVALRQKTERAQSSWAQKEQTLQDDAAKLQDRYQRGLITTANAQAEQERIQQRAVEFQASAQTEMRKLEEENMVFTNRTRELMRKAVVECNADKRYRLIIDASALIEADTTLNITPRIIELVNRIYAEEKAETKKK